MTVGRAHATRLENENIAVVREAKADMSLTEHASADNRESSRTTLEASGPRISGIFRNYPQ